MSRLVRAGAASILLAIHAASGNADVRLASNWNDSLNIPIAEWETTKIEEAMHRTATPLSATSSGRKAATYKPDSDIGFQLHLDGEKYYIEPALFMAKDRPDEVCTPASFKKAPTYQCEEGQRYRVSCHLMFFNSQFENIGVYRFRPQEPYETYCNAVLAMGVADKDRNELFVTFQYFPIDRPVARAANEIGKGWTRMTSLLRLTLADGRISVAEDGDCIPNPNALETIPDARVALKRCRGTIATKLRE